MAKGMIMAYDTLDLAHRKALGAQYRFDSYALSSSEDGSKVISLPFYHYRGYRINAMAVTGLLARVYSYWGGEKLAIAAKNAQEVVDFKWTREGDLALNYTENGWDGRLDYDRKYSVYHIHCCNRIIVIIRYQLATLVCPWPNMMKFGIMILLMVVISV